MARSISGDQRRGDPPTPDRVRAPLGGSVQQRLKKHYPEELARGGAMATAMVGQSLYRMATDWMKPGEGGRPCAPDKAAVAAAIFWMKARAGWSEKVKL